jgi:hypothetical protein
MYLGLLVLLLALRSAAEFGAALARPSFNQAQPSN